MAASDQTAFHNPGWEMSKHVLDVGNCKPDYAAIRRLIETSFDAHVTQTHGLEDTVTALRARHYDLVLVQRHQVIQKNHEF